ncbi:MAG TPA: STAS domain-containing protein [Phycisphaerae bacterium]|nr:STAS domain-containing protein [Phycisphaerae bacterium]HOJ73996.1 STAS domain-containing protein [Phycisphaerae bacterium]HOM50591.1 STAS domain-containing protein [Phycisphaerae bacterium]HON65100.1 STAS domain-containing protein [Phycisphaerae bacterium]HOQ86228.1 STAS domain-containing protein [Phycisphaerae bacterium]
MKVELGWTEEGVLTLTCSGQMGWDAQDELVKPTVEVLADCESPRVLIILESVELITSAGLGSLLQLRKLVIERGGELILAAPSPAVNQLFKTVGLERHVKIVATVEEAMALFSPA